MNRTLHRTMRAIFGVLTVALLLSASAAQAQITTVSGYIFSAGTGTATDMTGATTAIGTNFDDGVVGPFNIGFNFVFCGTTYSQFCVSSNGYMGLGGTNANSYLSGCFNSSTLGVPYIAPFWRDEYTANGGVTYITTGTSPNRILTVQWSVNACCSGGVPGSQYQARLYEGSNKFDMWYGAGNVSCGTIGAAVNTSNYGSITTPSSISYSSCNSCNSYPAINTVYSFSQCNVTFTGNLAQGGTAAMANGDELLANQTIQRGNPGAFQPFTINGPGCGPTTLNFAITGTAAADYSITPSSQTISSAAPYTPTINFTPTANGKRSATLTITGPGVNQTYLLGATATPRITFTGNIPQGGSVNMANRDSLMNNVSVTRGQSQGFTPFTLTNINTNGAAPGAVIKYTIKGISGGQYSITPSSTLTAGQTVSPVITFSPTGVGLILDSLIVNAEGDIRTYSLKANSIAPGGSFTINAVPLDSNSNLFNNLYGCLGEESVTYPIDITSNGFGAPLTITSVEFYSIDTTYRQGQPKYPFLRDGSGKIIPATDYILTLAPPVYPITSPANALNLPLSYPSGTVVHAYLTFIGQRPDKRFAKLVIRTNAQNFSSRDTNGVLTQGLLSFELYARGRNASLSDNVNGGIPKAVAFPNTKVGESTTKNLTLVNSGPCTLRVSLKDLEIISGDQKEFKIISMPTTGIDPVTNDLLLAPGTSNTGIVVRFTPIEAGSRRATIALWTNDSTVVIPGHTRRGVYYLDLYGFSPAILTASNLDLGTALIGGTGADQHSGVVNLENTSNSVLDISKVIFAGADSADFIVDPAHPWPTNLTLQPGQRLELGVIFAPATGETPGPRTIKVKLILANGDTVEAVVVGVAGTRTVEANPQALNFNLVLARGQYTRQTVTITNTGTMPVTLTKPVPSGAAASDFSVGMLPRLELQPGQSEYLEVTYHATILGTSTATLAITGNQTNGPRIVILNGTAATTRRVDDIPTATTGSSLDGVILTQQQNDNNHSQSVAGADGEVSTEGMALRQNVPNPTRGDLSISYRLADRSNVTLSLYDGNGRLVKVLDAGIRTAGEQTIHANVSDLPTGMYHYRLMANGRMLDRTMQIVK